MEPQLPPVNPMSEREPVLPQEHVPEISPVNMLESAPIQSVEKEVRAERPVVANSDAAGTVVTPVLPAPVPVVAQQTVVAPVSDNSTTPMSATDGDRMEKEWVDKSKRVIQATKDDPYEQEKQVGQLKVDYVKKRYGKEVGKAQD